MKSPTKKRDKKIERERDSEREEAIKDTILNDVNPCLSSNFLRRLQRRHENVRMLRHVGVVYIIFDVLLLITTYQGFDT